MVHMEYYLVVSTFMMFAGIYGFFTRRNLLAMLISATDFELRRYQLRRVQRLPLPQRTGRSVLRPVRHRSECCGNSGSYCHYHQYLS